MASEPAKLRSCSCVNDAVHGAVTPKRECLATAEWRGTSLPAVSALNRIGTVVASFRLLVDWTRHAKRRERAADLLGEP